MTHINNSSAKLNTQQKESINYNKGPLLIVAGAGTGKTYVIVEKIKHIIKNKLAAPENILALTFTEKAAAEMEERVDKALPFGYFPMWISTFHSFADKILKEEAIHIGINPSYKLLTQTESVMFINSNLYKFKLNYFRPTGNPQKFTESLYQHFSRLKDEYISPHDYIRWAKAKQKSDIDKEEKEKILELAYAYEQYQKLMMDHDNMDFSDLNYYLLELFKIRKNILNKYKNIFKNVLVDEFQDTNIAQYELIKFLCPPNEHPNLTVVGDDSQAIYKFRGASVSNILTFMKDYKNAKLISLRKNYRSNQQILDGAYRLIQNNNPDTLESKLKISKNLISQENSPTQEEKINFFWTNDSDEEANFVASEIIKLKEKYSYSDIAILVRANNHADSFAKTLSQKGIPYQFLGPGVLYKQPEIKDLIAYLKTLTEIEDSVSLYRVLSMNIFNISYRDLAYLLSFSKKTNLPLFSAIEFLLSKHFNDVLFDSEINYSKTLPKVTQQTIKKLYKIYILINKHLSKLSQETAGEILYDFLEETGYLAKIVKYSSVKEEKITLNISKFFKRLKEFETNNENNSVFDAINFILMSMELGESPSSQDIESPTFDAVNILTVHSSKGLEFPVVFIVNLTKDRFPTRERKELLPIPKELIKEILPVGDYHLQEERRLFYVALTRAKDFVYLTSSKWYGEAKRLRRLSPFIIDTLGEEYIQKKELKISDSKAQLSIFEYKKHPDKSKKSYAPLSYLSYSRINTFLTCPLKYKYSYILNIPVSKNAALVFGETIHTTLQKFYQQFIKNKKLGLKDLMLIYKNEWQPIGFSSIAHQNKMFNDGKKMLNNFFNKYHDKNVQIIDLEKPFRVKTAQGVILSGKMDRVDDLGDNKIEIIDYKTGKVPNEKELKKDLQLSIYFLAATDKGMYNKKPEEILLSLFYLQEPKKISYVKKSEDIQKIKEDVSKIIENIELTKFTPKKGPWCMHCPYRMICEAWQ